MPTVRMPDGALVDMPDSPTPEQLSQLQRLEPSIFDRIKQTGASTLAGFGKGAALVPKVLGLLSMTVEASKSFQELGDSTEQYWKEFGETHGLPKGYGRAMSEGLGGAAAGGAVTPSGLLAGITSGAGAEAGENLGGDNALAKIAGALVGGLAGGGLVAKLSNVRPQSGTIAQEAMEGISDKMLAQAKKLQAVNAAKGVDIDLAQALTAVGAPAGNITTLRNFLATKKQGTEIQQTLQRQPGQLSMEADQVAGRLPGTNYGQTQAANNLQEAATNRLTQARSMRSAAAAPLYNEAGQLPQFFQRGVQQELSDFMKNTPGLTADAAAKVREAMTMVQKNPRTGQPMTHSADYDELIRNLRGPFTGQPMNRPDGRSNAQLGELADTLRVMLNGGSPATKRANEVYSAISRDVVDPLKQGPVGQIATRLGYRADTQATITKFESLMRRGTDASARNSDIVTLGKELSKVDKEAFSDALKSYVSSQIKKSVDSAGTAQASANNADMAQRIADSLWKNDMQWQGLKDAVAQSAKNMGQKPSDVVRGLENFQLLVKAASARPGSPIGGLQANDVFRMGGQNMGADAMRIFGFLPFERAARRLEDAVLDKTLRQFDNILTSPEGADLLVKLSKVSPTSRKAMILLGTFGSANANSANPPDITRE